MDSYRRGFNGMEKDDEMKGDGNSYDFGSRMYDNRVARFLSLDAYMKKAPDSSPFSFAANTPISCIDNNGDSVLFYSASGIYLGFSHDNERYKNLNLVVIIKDKHVNAFKEEYNRKKFGEIEIPKSRTTETSRKAYRDAVVAGLESMGTTYNITECKKFLDMYQKKTKINGVIVDAFEVDNWLNDIEFGRPLKITQNPIVKNKYNWRTIDWRGGAQSGDDQTTYWEIPTPCGDIHLHTSHLNFTISDDDTDRLKQLTKRSPDEFSIIAQGTSFRLDNLSRKKEIIIKSNSFKDAKEVQ